MAMNNAVQILFTPTQSADVKTCTGRVKSGDASIVATPPASVPYPQNPNGLVNVNVSVTTPIISINGGLSV